VPTTATSNFTTGVTDAVLGTATTPLAITVSLSASAAAGKTKYDASCAGCHKAGIYDTTGGFPDLGLTTLAAINARFSGGANHNGQTLTAAQITEMFDFVSLY
jgi:mono/diheme cytochrome c family protein